MNFAIDQWLKSCIQNNDIEIYPNHNGGKSTVAERFIETSKIKCSNLLLQSMFLCHVSV